jgi:hypothetical protein
VSQREFARANLPVMKSANECFGTNVRRDLSDWRVQAHSRVFAWKELLDFELLQKVART